MHLQTLLVLLLCVLANAASPAQRAKEMLQRMTLEEKIAMVHGTDGPYVGNIAANQRLDIPSINMNDGPQGFRCGSCDQGTSTQWPSGLTVAATWNVNAMKLWGEAMGLEFAMKGANVQLGPGLCVARVPRNGRNFEYLSGEDPFLGSVLVQPVITGIQSQGVIANAKHYINNNQETNRNTVSENLSERVEWEMYMPPFVGAVEAGVLSVMCSYNKINNTYSCENSVTLGNLKQKANFSGWVMSDWGATHSTKESALAGLDQEMPGDTYYGAALQQAVANGSIEASVLDDKVLRILTAMYTIGVFDRPNNGNITSNVTSAAHNQLARQLSAEATVLMKNDPVFGTGQPLLPLDKTTRQKIAVIGTAGRDAPITGGGGSGRVGPPYQITGYQGILNKLGAGAQVTYAPSEPLQGAIDAAKAADVVIAFTATSSHEGADRANLSLPTADDVMITAVAKVQPKLAVVMAVPGATLTPWADLVPAIVNQFMPGQEAGNAAADVLFGDVNPSAKLPLTFPNIENEQGFTQKQWPGLPADDPVEAYYSEGVLFGYRWYDWHDVQPRFAFGHGLSYTKFAYTQLSIVPSRSDDDTVATVSFNLANVGQRTGQEVAQLYLGFPLGLGEPLKQLKGFAKVSLPAHTNTTIFLPITTRDISIWDTDKHDWAPQHGAFTVFVGASSRDIRLSDAFTV